MPHWQALVVGVLCGRKSGATVSDFLRVLTWNIAEGRMTDPKRPDNIYIPAFRR